MPASGGRQERIARLRTLLTERIVVIDGALGTSVQQLGLSASDFGGAAFEGCNEQLVRTRPGLIRRLHDDFLAAGADLIETDSFGATSIVLAEFGLRDQARALNRMAAAIAREAADAASTPEWPRFVIGAMGPTTRTISVTGGVSFDELAAAYQEQAAGLLEGGADVLLLETVQDTVNAKAGLIGIDRAMSDLGIEAAVAVQGTVEAMGTLLAGQDIEAFYVSLSHRDLLWMGLNCATGPDFMTDHLRTLAAISRFATSCVPNAGLPDENGLYHESPERLASVLERFMQAGWLNLVGGCCGTRPEHVRLLSEAARRHQPRIAAPSRQSIVSGIETAIIDRDTRPVLVGERTNVLGSRRFKRLIAEGRFDEAAEIGRAQIRRGAQILDVCLQDPDRDEALDLRAFVEVLVRKVKAPIMIDSTDPGAVERALKCIQGKALINSINLEDGPRAERLVRVVQLARHYGAGLVVGCIDEDPRQAQAITRERKLAIAERAFALLTRDFGILPEDIYFDALVFPAGTGDAAYIGSGVETIEGIRAIKAALPDCKTILGVSNVSFGLPAAGREVLNAVMLYHCVQAGLDLAIVDAERLPRYGSIPEHERRLAEDLIWWRGSDPIAAFAAHFGTHETSTAARHNEDLPLDERLARYIIEGSRDGLVADLDLALRERSALDIINGPLMRGMDEVGRMFAANQMIVAEVLQSAEAMKAAVSHLEPHMEKHESRHRGTILLATVKGDVHDIGKNLVDIILSNNGFRVVNLGIKVAPEALIDACRLHHPDAIGLSGLLVKSAQMMAQTAGDLSAAGIDCPLLVGGAALSARFTRTRIAPAYSGLVAYAADAMNGLEIARQVVDRDRRAELAGRLADETARMLAAARPAGAPAAEPNGRPAIRRDVEIPPPPDLEPHVIEDCDLGEIFTYVNPMMLYARHLGLRDPEHALARGDLKALGLKRVVEEVQAVMIARRDIRASACYRFFAVNSDGQQVVVYDDDVRRREEFTFGRQADPPHLCLADFIAPGESGRRDYLCMFVTTVGPGIRALAEQWKSEGEYLRSHLLQVLALEGAEAFAELLHSRLRAQWGIGDAPGLTRKDLFRAQYRGKRYSFGYPSCPRLEDQVNLFRLLDVEHTIGVRLTEGFMMEPEGSVSALVLHHPEARYFALSEADIDRLAKSIEGEPQRNRAWMS